MESECRNRKSNRHLDPFWQSSDMIGAWPNLLGLAAALFGPPNVPWSCKGPSHSKGRHVAAILADGVYGIAGETMRNALWHSESQRIEVQIRYDDLQFGMCVRDDGKGIKPKVLAHNGTQATSACAAWANAPN
jgi:hypothetical protein